MPDLKALIVARDLAGIRSLLKQHPALANQGIGFDKTLPNLDGVPPLGFLQDTDVELMKLLS